MFFLGKAAALRAQTADATPSSVSSHMHSHGGNAATLLPQHIPFPFLPFTILPPAPPCLGYKLVPAVSSPAASCLKVAARFLSRLDSLLISCVSFFSLFSSRSQIEWSCSFFLQPLPLRHTKWKLSVIASTCPIKAKT